MELHPKFKLNGTSYDETGLIGHAKTLCLASDYRKDIGRFLLDWFDPHPELLVQTSGSTGTPKTIPLEKRNMVNSALATGEHFKLPPGTSALLCLSANHIAGKMMLVRAMVLGWDLDHVMVGSRPLSETGKRYGFSAMVPLQAYPSIAQLNRLDKLIIGGGRVSAELAIRLGSVSTEIHETYGMTETITHIATKPLDALQFKTLPQVTVSKDQRGCLVIDAPHLAHEPIVTNDLVALEGNTGFRWLGRYDNIINSGGVKMIPEQLERKLAGLISNRYFIAGVPDAGLGEKVILLVEGVWDGPIAAQHYDQAGLSKYEIPKAIIVLDRFVETASGKIARKATMERV